MDSGIQLASMGVLVLVFIINALIRRRADVPQRPIGAFESLRDYTGRSIEASEPIHVSLGSASLGDETTLLALAGADFIYYLTREASIGDASPIFTATSTTAIPLAVDTLRRAYHDENRPELFQTRHVRWYPAGARSLAFAGGIMSIQQSDKVSANMLVGTYGIELALILDASQRHGNPSVAVSHQLEGQAVAYAMADEVLIGEEIFAAPGYLSADSKWSKRNVVTDILRWLLVAAILALLVLNLISGS